MRLNSSLIVGVIALSIAVNAAKSQYIQSATDTGPAGTPGSVFWMGPTEPPSPTLGAVTDVYSDTVTANVYQKFAAPTGWQYQMNIKGDPGTNGSNGTNGTNGATGAQGPQGISGTTGAQGSPGTPGTTFLSTTATTATDGTFTWTFSPAFAGGVLPQCWGQARGPDPAAGTVLNVQTAGSPTNTTGKFTVTRSAITTVALLGLNILSIPGTVGAQTLDLFCKAP